MRSIIFVLSLFSFISCSIKPPPITFTQSQTATERQMIGSDKQLESDGWLISSIKTSSSGSEDWKKDAEVSLGTKEESRDFFIILRSLAYFTPEIRRLKQLGIAGEALNGHFSQNPLINILATESEYANEEGTKRVKEVIEQVNSFRDQVYMRKIHLLEKESKLPPLELEHKKNEIKLLYYNQVEEGEFYEIEKGKWIKKE